MLIQAKYINNIKISRVIHHALMLFCIITSTSVIANNIYKIDKLSPNGIITISLSLQSNNIYGKATKLSIRNDLPVSAPQVENVRCGVTKLTQDSSGYWHVPTTCNTVTWDVKPKLVDDEFVDIAEQMTLKLKKAGWILFSESTSLLRIDDNIDSLSLLVSSEGIPLLGATAHNSSWVIPSVGSAPEFYIIGNPTSQIDHIGGLTVKYVIDDSAQTNWLELQKLHKKILLYLTNILSFPTNLPKDEHSLLVIWMGINTKYKQVNGSAGRRSFIANYVFGKNEEANSLNNLYSLLVLAHEQFHQFVDMARFPRSYQTSVWIEESLAQYYAIKSLQSVLSDDNSMKIREKFITPNNTIDFKFIELEKQIKEGNYKNYSLFYNQGAQFWYELDQVLLTSSKGKYGLDSLLVELIKSESNDGQLPREFKQKVINIGGEEINKLFNRYVE